MKEKRILIALEKLDAGGIETFVLNQIKALSNNNIEVFIIAKKGNYYDKFKKAGAKIIDYEFKDSIYIEKNKIQKMCEILTKNKITEVHINQFPSMNVLAPACILTGIPYVVYLHMAADIIKDPVHNAYNYFERQYITYNKSFKILFKYAAKIVAITKAIKDYTAKKYTIDPKKIIVRPNTIDTKSFSTTKKVEEIKKVLIISRISIEKKNVIINAIKLYQKLKEKNNEVTLQIAGSGNLVNDVEKYIKDKKIQDVNFLGNISNVKEVMEKQDLIIAVDRCILEALCLGKLAVISGYHNMKGLVTTKNINTCIKENFCGASLETENISKVANTLIKLKKEDISKITNNNLQIVRNKLDVNKNIFYLKNTKVNYNIQEYVKDIYELTEILGKSQIEYYNKAEEIWKAYKNNEAIIQKRYKIPEAIIKKASQIKYSIKKRIKRKKN